MPVCMAAKSKTKLGEMVPEFEGWATDKSKENMVMLKLLKVNMAITLCILFMMVQPIFSI